MSKQKLKKELHELIDKMEDEAILSILKEDIVAYQKTETGFDDLSDLTAEQRKELEESIIEDPEKDVVTEEEFNAHIETWKKRLLSTRKDS